MRRRVHSAALAVAALGLSVWACACTTYSAPRAGRPLSTASRIRVQSPAPIEILAPAGSPTPGPLCRVAWLDGTLERMSGDTLIFREVSLVMSVPGATRSDRCPRVESGAMVVRTDEMRVGERRSSPWRTTVLVLTVFAILVGFAALGASQIEPGFPSGAGF